MSAKFKNMLMTGGTFNFAEGDINFHSSDASTTDSGIEQLFKNVAPGAFHDSGERFDPPKCHPNTRVAVIQEIIDWLDDPDSSELVMWLHGAAGAGKSAIAQTIAQMLFEQGRLSGSFFFARGSTTGRGDHKRLVPTLAYQLVKYLPETEAHIDTAVLKDRSIFGLSLLSQVQNLLIDPLCIADSSSSNTSRLFIIDGLDECRDSNVQCFIVQVFAAAVKSMQHPLPHKVLIASRPEIHLLSGFSEHDTAAVCRRLPLDNSYHPDNDIRLFLQDKFSKIKGEHHMRSYLENPWPSDEIISSLVRKSSGQFIYASTVVKFVTSHRHHPAERLKIILGLKPAGRNDRPYAELDSLYTHIFQNAEDIELVLCILRVALVGSFLVNVPPRVSTAEVCLELLGITVEELELALGDLISIISFNREEGWFIFLHASFPDFLIDAHRSGTFYVDQPKVNLYRFECCMKVLCSVYGNNPYSLLYRAAWFHLSDCIGRLVNPADKELLYQLLPSLDMRLVFDHHFRHQGRSRDGPFRDIGRVLLWSLQELQTHPDKATSLFKLTQQFDVWLLSHLEPFSINGFDNELDMDLMIFSMIGIDGDNTILDHRFNILGVLEDGVPIPSVKLVSVPANGELFFPWHRWLYASHYTEYFILLRHFFHDPKRSGKYFMSGDRYANGALHCAQFLFDTGRNDTRNWDEERWLFERETFYLAMKYATFFLEKATALKALFELLLGVVTIPEDNCGISSIISVIEINAQCRLNSRIGVIFQIETEQMPSPPMIGINRMLDRSVGESWEEKNVRMVVAAMSKYVSATCRSFFPQNVQTP